MTPGGTTARGYGADHKRARAQYARLVNAGQATCSRCAKPITPGAPWDLDHSDDRTGYLGPAHQACNRAAGTAKANRNRTLTLHTSGSW